MYVSLYYNSIALCLSSTCYSRDGIKFVIGRVHYSLMILIRISCNLCSSVSRPSKRKQLQSLFVTRCAILWAFLQRWGQKSYQVALAAGSSMRTFSKAGAIWRVLSRWYGLYNDAKRSHRETLTAGQKSVLRWISNKCYYCNSDDSNIKTLFFPQICKEIVTPVKKGDRNYQAIFIRNFSSAQL